MNRFKNIIFDFGGVLINIDYQLTVAAFKKLGITNFDELYSKLNQSSLFDEFEKGNITAADFRNRIRDISNLPLQDNQIDDAWNALLIDLPEESIDFLSKLKMDSRLFLLSNTNEIHETAFTSLIQNKFGKNVLEESFERIYFSHHMHLRKPDPEIFKRVLDENRLSRGETLFIDDSFLHIEGAKQVGLSTFYFDQGKRLEDIDLEKVK